jgi:hypothetical protein
MLDLGGAFSLSVASESCVVGGGLDDEGGDASFDREGRRSGGGGNSESTIYKSQVSQNS